MSRTQVRHKVIEGPLLSQATETEQRSHIWANYN